MVLKPYETTSGSLWHAGGGAGENVVEKPRISISGLVVHARDVVAKRTLLHTTEVGRHISKCVFNVSI